MKQWIPCTTAVRPGPGETQVYFLERARYAGWMAQAAARLTDKEQEHASGIRHPQMRNRYILTRAALRSMIAIMLNEEVAAADFARGSNGKPLLDRDGLHFSISHSRDCSLISFSMDAQVGVDLETVHRVFNAERMMARFFHADERAWWQAQPNRDRAFLYLWTRKEALLKRGGEGISVSLETVNTLESGNASHLVNLEPDAEHIAAVAVSAVNPQISCSIWEPGA